MDPLHIARKLAASQLPSGQFPTFAVNVEENLNRRIGTLTPTYLVCLLLSLYRERYTSNPIMDGVIERCLSYIESRCYYDPIEGYRVWHFNAFYPPDWEEACWCTWMLYKAGRLDKKDLTALYDLMRKNETEANGVGVWLRHPYCVGSKYKNVFDGFVDLSIVFWLEEIFHTRSVPTDAYLAKAISEGKLSLYYFDGFARFFFSLFGRCPRPTHLPPVTTPLFHQGSRRQVQYVAPDVWRAASLFVA